LGLAAMAQVVLRECMAQVLPVLDLPVLRGIPGWVDR
jgi:hypothetical protein